MPQLHFTEFFLLESSFRVRAHHNCDLICPIESSYSSAKSGRYARVILPLPHMGAHTVSLLLSICGRCTNINIIPAVVVAMRVNAIYGGPRWMHISLWTAGCIFVIAGLAIGTVGTLDTICELY